MDKLQNILSRKKQYEFVRNKQKTEIFQRVSVVKCNAMEKTQFISNEHSTFSNYEYINSKEFT